MAGLLEDLLSGRSSDIYGAGLLTPEQRGGIGNIGLLALAGKLGQLAGPSFSPVPDFGAALGQAAGAYGASQEGAGTAALNAILTAQKGRKLQQELDYYKQLGPVLGKLAGQWPGADGGAAATPETGTSGYMAASPGAGGGGSANGTYWTPEGLAALRPTEGRYDQIHYPGGNPSTATGAYGFLDSTWREQAAKAGVDINQYPRAYLAPPAVQDRVAAITPIHHWTGVDAQGKPFNAAAQRLATNPNYVAGAAPTAAAPAGGGGLLNLPQVPNFARDQLGGGTVPLGVNIGPTSDAVPGQGASEESPGFAGRQLVAQLLGRAPIADASQYQQVAGPGGGDAPGGMASGLLTPGGPLTRGGVPGLPVMPPAAAPSADPSSQLGPLAVPAPAAAAPAAAGPGLLSPPGMPAAAALPRVNPAYDAYARQLAIAAGLAKGAGLPDVLAPLLEAFKGSPAYKAQQIIAEKGAAQPFEQAQTLFNKQVEIAGVGPIEAAKLPYALAQTYFKAEQDIRTAGPVAAAQNFERIKADNAAKAIITTKDADGNIKLSIDPDALDAVTRATITAPKQAEADIARETTRIQQEQQARYEPMPGGVPVMGADGKTTMMPMSRYEYDLRQRLQQERRGAGAPSSSPQPGDIVGTPYVSKEDELSQASDQKRLDTMQTTAQASRLAIQNANDLRQLIENGAILGPGADKRTQLLKLGQLLNLTGKDQNDLIANTETFIARQGAELKTALQGLGPPVSDRDLGVAANIAGNQNLTPQGLLELMQIKEKYHRQALSDYNQIAEKAPPSRYPRVVNEPPTYGAKTATGPNGQRMWEKSPGNWVAF